MTENFIRIRFGGNITQSWARINQEINRQRSGRVFGRDTSTHIGLNLNPSSLLGGFEKSLKGSASLRRETALTTGNERATA
jgi:hypothetical protein